jgi:hypothetical protein
MYQFHRAPDAVATILFSSELTGTMPFLVLC